MFECRACLLRCIRAVAGDAPLNHTSRTTRLLATQHHASARLRRYTTGPSSPAALDVAPTGLVPGKQPLGVTTTTEKALKIELRYLQDPVKFAQHIQYTLKCDKPDKALDLCRLASKTQEVVVAWNHCVDWYMSRGKTQEAIKIYNEMKKRAQFPDSHTYRALLSGLAKRGEGVPSNVRTANLTKALSIYYSMSSPTSRVKPTLYHTNAVLHACSAAEDVDAIWAVVAKLPKRGPTAPDHITYATVLHGIRHAACSDGADSRETEELQDHDQRVKRRQQAVQEGRQLWQDIVSRWRGGEIKIDEELVCAMGSLLLISSRLQDWDDVFSLVQQTMKIERQVEPLGSVRRHTNHIPGTQQERSMITNNPEDDEGFRDVPSTKVFDPVLPPSNTSSKSGSSISWAYVQPGNRTLSLLIQACTLLRIPKIAKAYWSLLNTAESPFGLKPDLLNYQAQLSLLSKNRASGSAVSLLKEMLENGVKPKNQTLRMAMSICCVRDRNNQHALENAGQIVIEMDKHDLHADAHTLMEYLKLASAVGDGPQVVAALKNLDPMLHRLRSQLGKDADKYNVTREPAAVDNSTVVAFFQMMLNVVEKVIDRKVVKSDEELRDLHGRLKTLISYAMQAAGTQRARPLQDGGQDVSGRSDQQAKTREARVSRRKVSDANVYMQKTDINPRAPAFKMQHLPRHQSRQRAHVSLMRGGLRREDYAEKSSMRAS